MCPQQPERHGTTADHQRRPQAVSHRRGSLAISPNPGSSHSLSPSRQLHDTREQLRSPVQTLDSQHPSLCATCSVVAKDIEETATPAGTRGRREREPEAPKKQHTESRRINPRQGRRGEARERNTRQRASLRSEHRLFRGRETWPDTALHFQTVDWNCGSALPPMSWDPWFSVHFTDADGCHLPTLPNLVPQTQQLPPSGTRGGGHLDGARCGRTLLGVSVGSFPDSPPNSTRKLVVMSKLRCATPDLPVTEEDSRDPSTLNLGQPQEVG